MNRKPLKKFLPFLISSITLTTITVLACSGGDWDGTEGSMFSPNIIAQEKYVPFFRTVATPFFDGYDHDNNYKFGDINIGEWNKNYFENALTNQALNYWLHEASLNQIDSMIFAIKGKSANLSTRSLEFTLKQIQPSSKATAFLYYLGYAKRNEAFAVKSYSYWEEEPKKPSIVTIEKQITGGLSFFTKTTDLFLKERYAFQIIRSYYFKKEYDKAIAFYNDNKSVFKSGNSMMWRALGYKAASFYKQRKFAESNYIYSQIFAMYEPLKKSAYLSFHPQQPDELKECLALAKSTKEKEIIWQLQGLNTNQVLAMKEILKLDPKSEAVDVLLVRAINIEEEKFNSILVASATEQATQIASIDNELVQFLNEMSKKGDAHHPVIWHLSAAYLSYIKKDFATGDVQLKRAEMFAKSNPLMEAQYHLISLVGKVSRLKEINDQHEKELLVDLKFLYRGNSPDEPGFRGNGARAWIRTFLAELYLQKKETEKAEVINPGRNNIRFENIENIQDMISYFDKLGKSEFEKLFVDNAFYGKNDYLAMLGIRYAQKDQLELALSTFKSMPNYNRELYGNPFTIHIKDCHDCDHMAKQKTKYTSISFIEKMIEMKNTAVAKPNEAAQNYFLVANGFYNMTYFGNARYFYSSPLSEGTYYYGRHELLPEEDCVLALKYYLLAKEKSMDAEFKAKCTFMAAKCEQNLFFMNKPQDYKGDFKSGQYFTNLKKEYASTKYYQEIIKECGYFKTYLGR